MPGQRTPHSPVDHLLAQLNAAISAPHRVDQIKPDFFISLKMVNNAAHRRFLEDKFGEVEEARNSFPDLARIEEEIVKWQDREFPVRPNKR
jgi:hypothetical protein